MSMGEFFTYSLASALILMLLYLAYRLVKAPDNHASLNRFLLWSIYAVALLSPALYPAISKPAHLSAESGEIVVQLEQIGFGEIPVKSETSDSALSILLWVYLAGMIIAALSTAINFFRIFKIIRTGKILEIEGHKVIVTDREDVAPFSFGGYIVVQKEDSMENLQIIIRHEQSHIKLAHWLDLFFAQAVGIFQWYNPAAWLMQRELKNVHEYQADHCVVSSGVDIRKYQLLLIKKAVGARFPSLANSLNHSKLKKRITMMYNQKRVRGGRMLRPLLLLPALGAALWLMNLPAVASAMDSIAESSLVAPSAETSAKITKFISNPEQISSEKSTSPSPMEAPRKEKSKSQKESKTFMAVDKVADFPGGMSALMNFLKENIKYPEGSSATGRVIVRFVVEANGSIGDVEIVRSVSPELDAEAERVVKLMPRWTPGEVNGKPVASYFNLPVSFKAEPTPKAATTDQGENGKNGFLSKSFSTSTTADGQTQTTVTITSRSEDGSMSVSTSSTGGDQPRYEVYVDGKKFEGDLSEISSSSIDSMKIDQTDDNPAKIYITLKK